MIFDLAKVDKMEFEGVSALPVEVLKLQEEIAKPYLPKS